MDKQEIIDFLEWMNQISQEDPMRLETDHEDIAMMYLESRGQDEECLHENGSMITSNGTYCRDCGEDTEVSKQA